MRKRIIIIFLIGLVVLIYSNHAFAQSAKDVVKALKKTESVTKVSNTGKEFLAAYADAKTEADMYLESPGKKNTQMVNSIKKVCLAYDWAVSLWKLKQSHKPEIPYIHENDDFVKAIYRDFPDSKNVINGTIQLDDAIRCMYLEAERELSKTTRLLFKAK